MSDNTTAIRVSVLRYDPASGKKRWHDAAAAAEVHEDGLTIVPVAGRDVVLTRQEGRLCAFDAECPHREGSLSRGRISDGNIRCPVHGYEFDVKTGRGVGNDLTLEILPTKESSETSG